MKTILILTLLIVMYGNALSQNITNTLGANGLFTIKDGTTTYLSLGLTNGYLSLNRSITLLYTTNSGTGVIYKGTDRFIHNYQSPASFGENTFVGINSGNFTMSGSAGESSYNTGIGMYSLFTNSTGYNNTALGHASLTYNNTGYQNTAIGTSSLALNSSGNNNTAVGFRSLLANTTGSLNTAIGSFALNLNTIGLQNTAIGHFSLFSNITGGNNVAIGHQSLYSNGSGIENTAVGSSALYSNTTGVKNTVVGLNSLPSNTTGSWNSAYGLESMLMNVSGSSNTAFGTYSGINITTGNNNIALGYFVELPSGTSSNQVKIGNSSISYAGIQVAWTITSDRKWKENIVTSSLGLRFINRLHPVSYTRINDESKKTEYGLIAQEVEEVLKEEDAENSAMITVTDEGNYELRYNDLIAPMVKAIQELKAENDVLKAKVESLKTIEVRLEKLEKIFKQNSNSLNVNLAEEK
ncbi:MAG: hypothetical protein HOP31_11025 [Ignavibacteria bacterium]|nr:hypothetical protein [Ignavibacteria bacterium]